jgi:hypothetical protein
MMNYSREHFHEVKGALFDLVEELLDSFRAIGSVDEYFQSRMRFMKKRMGKKNWKFQLKYSTGITKRCESEQGDIAARADKIVNFSKAIAAKMVEVGNEVYAGG